MSDYVALLKAARAHVEASVLYKRFISGTPLENDIAVWMADFAAEQEVSADPIRPVIARQIAEWQDEAGPRVANDEKNFPIGHDMRERRFVLQEVTDALEAALTAEVEAPAVIPTQEDLPEAAAAVLRANLWPLITDADPADVATIADVQTQYARLQEWYATLHHDHVVALAENERLRAERDFQRKRADDRCAAYERQGAELADLKDALSGIPPAEPGYLVVDLRYGSATAHHAEGSMGLHPSGVGEIMRCIDAQLDIHERLAARLLGERR
jgi:hypothetical protein